MKQLKDYFEEYFKRENESLNEAITKRMQELSGIIESKANSRYAIQITIETDTIELLLEYEQYKKFRKSNDLYYYHPEDTKIPVKAHYHVVNSKSKKEIYAVNTDGTAHHQKNRGFVVPKNHAKELTKLGVTFKNGNLLENISVPNQENKTYFTFFIILDE